MPAILTPWRAVSAMFLLNGALLGIWASRIPTIRDAQGLDKSQFGLLLLVMAVGALLSFPVAGRLADRFGAVLLPRGPVRAGPGAWRGRRQSCAGGCMGLSTGRAPKPLQLSLSL